MKYFYKDDSCTCASIDLDTLQSMQKNLILYFTNNKISCFKNTLLNLSKGYIHFGVYFEIQYFDISFSQSEGTDVYSDLLAKNIRHAKKLIDLYNSIINDKIALCPQHTETME